MNLVQIVFLACMALDAHYAVTNAKQVCHTTFTAGAVIDRELYLFKNQQYWRFNSIFNGNLVTTEDEGDKVTNLFGDALEGLNVKAIYQTTGRGVRVFTGKKYFDFSKNGNNWETSTPGGKDISKDFGGINNPNAAVTICASGCTDILINKKKYWEFDDKSVETGSVQERFGKGIPEKIDGAFKDGRDTMIIKGNGVFRIVGGTRKVPEHTQPKLLAAEFFPTACEEELGK